MNMILRMCVVSLLISWGTYANAATFETDTNTVAYKILTSRVWKTDAVFLDSIAITDTLVTKLMYSFAKGGKNYVVVHRSGKSARCSYELNLEQSELYFKNPVSGELLEKFTLVFLSEDFLVLTCVKPITGQNRSGICEFRLSNSFIKP